MKKKLKGFKPHEKVSRKRVMVPAVRINRKGYFILNAYLIKEIGESPGGFTMQFFYSKDQNAIAIQFKKMEARDLNQKEHIKLKTPRWTLCARDFLKSNKLDSRVDNDKFYPMEKILETRKDQTWAFSL
ncbi:MAG TPA: hypothetical protein PLF59_08305 [Cyclobacteriaceae bacterium]|nr:hypothetical protein [Cyclobacteriaceae bacterium]